MLSYILRRLLYAIPTLIGVSVIIFLAMRVVPGDPVAVIYGEEIGSLRPQDRAKIEGELGLDSPLIVQYGNWLKDFGSGNFGHSLQGPDTVMDIVKRRGPLTLEITLLAIIIAWVVGMPVGIISALRQNTWVDYIARFFTVLFLAIPGFWLASVIALALLLQWGYKAPLGTIDFWDNPKENLEIVWGPAVVLGLAVSSYISRMTRSTLLEVIREDYIRTARAKGLMEWVVVWRHALRNTMLPVLTLSGVLFGFMLGGTVVVEQAFGVPGLGRALVEAFVDLDYTVIQTLVLLYGAIFIAINLLIDISYAWLDPRIRYSVR